jgi:CRP/FNR family transcriptional regulator
VVEQVAHVLPPAADDEPVVDVLRRHRLFRTLPDHALQDLAATAIVRCFPKGQRLYYAGDPMVYIHVLTAGLVALTKMVGRGNEHTVLIFSTGDVLGIMSLMLDRRWTLDATAVTDVRAILVGVDAFDVIYRQHIAFAHGVARELADMYARSQDMTTRFMLAPVASRLAAFLLESTDATPQWRGRGQMVELGMSNQALASLLGTTRETLSRIVARLSRARVISMRGRRVQILRGARPPNPRSPFPWREGGWGVRLGDLTPGPAPARSGEDTSPLPPLRHGEGRAGLAGQAGCSPARPALPLPSEGRGPGG